MATYTGTDAVDTFNATDAADLLKGGGGADTLRAGGGDDVISGGAGSDLISAGGGDDRVIGGAGNDTINGGSGWDVAQYRGDLADYSLTVDKLGRLHLTDTVVGRDGADLVVNVEEFIFNGQHYTYTDLHLDTMGYHIFV